MIVSSDKLVEALTHPVPLELPESGLAATLERLGSVRLRDGTASPEGEIVADFTGACEHPDALATQLSRAVGVVEHGLLPPTLVSDVIITRSERIEHRRGEHARQATQ